MPAARASIAAFVAFCLSGAARAGDIESHNSVEYSFLERGRTEWYVGAGLRFRDGLGDMFDRRVYFGTTVALGRGIEIGGRYLFRYRQAGDLGLKPNQRVAVSLGYPLHHGRWRMSGHTIYERHFAEPVESDFNRYRQGFEIERGASASTPWLSTDLSFRREGLVRSRSRVGWKWRLTAGHEVSVAYQFDSVRDGHAWEPRHAIVTAFEFSRPKGE